MTTERRPNRPSVRVTGLFWALVVTALLAGGAAALAALVAGRPQVFGALVGAALVGGFFVFGTVNTSIAAAYAPRLSLVVALVTYSVQVVGLGLVLLGLTRSGLTEEAIDVRWLAGTVICGTLAWTVTLVVDASRAVAREQHPGAAPGDGPDDGAQVGELAAEVRR